MLEASRRRIHRLACKPAAVFLVHVCTFATEDADANVQKKTKNVYTQRRWRESLGGEAPVAAGHMTSYCLVDFIQIR